MKLFRTLLIIGLSSVLFTATANDTAQKKNTTQKSATMQTTKTAKTKKAAVKGKQVRNIKNSNWSKIKDMFL